MDVHCILGVGCVQAPLAQEDEVHQAPPSHTSYARVLALSAFRMWPLSTPLRAFSGSLVRRLALLSRDICDRSVEIRRSLKEDYAAYVQNIVGEAVSAAERHDIGVLYSLVKRHKRQKLPLPPNNRLEDGTMAQTTKQAQECWRRFHAATFSAQEHPVETDTTTCSDLDRDLLFDGFSTEVVRDILATLAPGKAAGEDLVANELLRSGGDEMAALLSDLFVKSAAACSVPQEWRGGMVRNIHKKGPIDDCSNSRGILTSSCIGKVCGRAFA